MVEILRHSLSETVLCIEEVFDSFGPSFKAAYAEANKVVDEWVYASLVHPEIQGASWCDELSLQR